MAKIVPASGFDDRVKLADAVPLPMPFTLNIFPTNLCNFSCVYCAQSQGRAYLEEKYGMGRGAMTLDTVRDIVKQSGGFPGKYKLVSFMGHGEPLLNKDLPEMVKAVHDAQITQRIEIITNASLLTRELSAALIDAGLTNLRVSLQGVNTDAYRRISNKELDYKNLLEQIGYYYRHKKQGGVFVKVLDISLGAGEDQEFYKQFDKICDRMFIEKVKPVYKGVKISEAKTLTTDRYGNEHLPRKVCPLPFFMLSVWPNGDVVPCDAIYKPALLGNISRGSLPDMWKSDVRKSFLLDHLSYKKDDLPGCEYCCAPDDVSHALDVLDDDAVRLKALFERR